jgi:glycosyltransferase involved in cell wall biosynthesis
MRLGFVTHRVGRYGGMERVSAEVLERIAEKHEVVIISRECDIRGTHLSWMPIRVPERPIVSLVWTFTYMARLAEAKAACTLTAMSGAAGRDAEVIVAHFCHAAFFSRFGHLRGGRNPLRRLYQQFAEGIYIRAERHAYSSPRLKRVIAVSQGLKRELVSHYGISPDKVVVVPNGVDHEVFKPATDAKAKQSVRRALSLPEDGFIALFLGGDWARKGLADAIRALAFVPEALLVVVGKGDVRAFRASATEHGVGSRVIFAGESSRPQDYYAAADVFVFPSRYEAFSLVTLEASASGLPIICMRINGTEELIEDGVNGFFVDADPRAIGERLRLLLDDENLRRQMSAAILASSGRYRWDRVAEEQCAVYEAVAAEMLSAQSRKDSSSVRPTAQA